LARPGEYIVDYPCICISVVKQRVLFYNYIQNEKIHAFSTATATTRLAPICFAMEVACGIEILSEHVLGAMKYLITFGLESLILAVRDEL